MTIKNILKLFYSELKYTFRFPFPEILFLLYFILLVYGFKSPQSIGFFGINYNYYSFTYLTKNMLNIFLFLVIIYSSIVSIKFSLQLLDGSISSYMLFPVNRKYFLLSKITSYSILIIVSEVLPIIFFILIIQIPVTNLFYIFINILVWSFFTVSIAIFVSLISKSILASIVTFLICLYPGYFSIVPNLFNLNYYTKGIIYGPAALNFIKYTNFNGAIIQLYLALITITFVTIVIIIFSIHFFTKIDMRSGK